MPCTWMHKWYVHETVEWFGTQIQSEVIYKKFKLGMKIERHDKY